MTRLVRVVDVTAVAIAAAGAIVCCRSSDHHADSAPAELIEVPRSAPSATGLRAPPPPPRQASPGREGVFESLRPARVEGVDDGLFLAVGENRRVCIVRRRGSVSCLGGTTASCAEASEEGPDEVFLDGIEAVATGYGHTCARARGGVVHCWGCNDAGQLGLLDPIEGHLPAVPALRGVAEIAVGFAGSCVRSRSGRVTCWGCLDECDPETVEPEEGLPPRRVDGLVARHLFSGGDWRLRAVTSDGTIVMLATSRSRDRRGFVAIEERRIPGVRIVEARGDPRFGCARAQTGAVYCWHSSVPERVEALGAVRALAAGRWHACALLDGGTVSCWGSNGHGQLGDGTTEDRPSPRPVPGLDGVIAIGASTFLTCALRSSGETFCWGTDDDGAYGYW